MNGRLEWICILGMLICSGLCLWSSQQQLEKKAQGAAGGPLQPYVISVQPIVVRDDQGRDPAPMGIPQELIQQAYAPAGIGFSFLEPVYYDNTQARDGLINLDTIVLLTKKNGIIKDNANLIHLFFINAVDGKKGPLGRGMMNGNITFVVCGGKIDNIDPCMLAFAVAHEIGHNLNLQHAIDDPQVLEKAPNLMGDGPFCERIGPKSLTPYQVGIIKKSPLVQPRLDALSRQEGAIQINDESLDRFASVLNRQELAAYTARKIDVATPSEISAEARKIFAAAVMDFTADEKAALAWSVEHVNELLLKNGLGRMAAHPWRFIKTENWLCDGFSYTRGLCIVLSEKRLQGITRLWQDAIRGGDATKALRGIAPLLAHEQMHNLQRAFPKRFAQLYQEKWGYFQAHVETDSTIESRKVTNPDATQAEWLIPSQDDANKMFWVRVLFGNDADIPKVGKDFVEKVFVVQKKDGKWAVTAKDGQPESVTMEQIAFFNERFPVTTGIDHPNEIAAYMFAAFFRNEILGGKETKWKNEKSAATYCGFIYWCKENFK